MKIEKLTENKLKITLDVNDLRSRNIDARSFIYNTPESQDLFWDAMQEAEKQYGFEVEESMIYVEAHMSSTGIFTLIVTKNTSNTPNNTSKRVKLQKKSFELKRKDIPMNLNDSLFRFDSFDALLNFCKIADSDGYGKTSLYMLDKSFYLYITKYSGNSILEFANIESNKDSVLAQISEYGKVIYSNKAIQTIKNAL